MVPVVIERGYRGPVTLAMIEAADAKGQWCIAANGGRAVLHALSGDGRNSICVYNAPDAEAMRRVNDIIGRDHSGTAIWSSTEHWAVPGGAPPRLATAAPEAVVALVDRHFAAPTDYRTAQALEDEQGHCLVINGVRHLRSYLSLDRMRMLCLYAAPDLEAVRSANRLTGLPVTDTLAVMVRDPG